MIVSHRHRYVFVELPRTGCTAVRRELLSLYDGEPILYKHVTYPEFLKVASEEEKRYFVFSTIRNPLDQTVSRYFKLKTDHQGQFSDPRAAPRKRLVDRIRDGYIFRYVRTTDADFTQYVRRFRRLPYDTWASLSHHEFDFVMRFETLADDFERALRLIGIEPQRRLPVVNRTAARDRDFDTYYPPALRRQARRVFGPYMERWGYRFPESWQIEGPTTLDRAQYILYSFLARAYWRHVRPHTVVRSGRRGAEGERPAGD